MRSISSTFHQVIRKPFHHHLRPDQNRHDRLVLAGNLFSTAYCWRSRVLAAAVLPRLCGRLVEAWIFGFDLGAAPPRICVPNPNTMKVPRGGVQLGEDAKHWEAFSSWNSARLVSVQVGQKVSHGFESISSDIAESMYVLLEVLPNFTSSVSEAIHQTQWLDV